jgi:hypothetical protein
MRTYIDYVRCTMSFSDDSVAPDIKLSIIFPRVNYHLLVFRCCAITILWQIHPALGAAPLYRYRK